MRFAEARYIFLMAEDGGGSAKDAKILKNLEETMIFVGSRKGSRDIGPRATGLLTV